MQVTIFNNLIKHCSDLFIWNNPKSFEVDKLTSEERDRLQSFSAIQLTFPAELGIRRDRDVLLQFESGVKNLITTVNLNGYCVKTEHLPQKRNRIRSHKGVISRKVDKNDFIEDEVDVHDGNTLISGIFKINSNNCDYLFENFYSSSNCFILLSSRDLFNKSFLADIVKNHVIFSRPVIADYLAIVLDYINDNSMLLRSGGDGDVEICLTIFLKNNLVHRVLDNINIMMNFSDFDS